ncbi:hypothetical protein BDZ45DRAFT_607734 [Acephala macrosclerotiorum]|nr:hypothetical protein BDZ45DRAFT_607734 [Acephala macrosclerotiorum]
MQATPRATKARRSHAGEFNTSFRSKEDALALIRTGCSTCRARKVKCGERPGICANCERLELHCAGPNDHSERAKQASLQDSNDGTTVRDGSESRSKRKRTYRSCTECRSSKNRCSGDKPSCSRCHQKRLQCVAADHNENALICIICALGAQLYAVEYSNKNEGFSHKEILLAGDQWAKAARKITLVNLGDISVENLMAAVLLHDHELRMGNYANAFMLSGLTARMAQALQINLEYSTDVLCRDTRVAPSPGDRESRRRLAWSCYILDTLVGSGVDQLTLFDERDIKIQLPCDERSFLLQLPCITQTLEEGEVLRFLPPESVPPNTAENLGMMAHFIRHMKIRRKMLRYIKHLSTAKNPWLPDSEFVMLDTECRSWHETLPDTLKFTPASIYIRKETNQVGALCLLHLAYQNTMCDLYRIAAPALYKLRGAFEFPPEQHGFLSRLQSVLYEHGKSVSLITAEAMRHGPNTLADSWIPSIIYDASRIMLYHITQLIDPARDSNKTTILETVPLLKSNIEALKMMRSLCAIANPLVSTSIAGSEVADW